MEEGREGGREGKGGREGGGREEGGREGMEKGRKKRGITESEL